jgi:hypothetical protein
MANKKPTPRPEVEATDEQLLYQLEQWFPWLIESEDDVNGADLVDGIGTVHSKLKLLTKKAGKKVSKQGLLDTAKEAQQEFWDKLTKLENALGVDIDSTTDLIDHDIYSLKRAG